MQRERACAYLDFDSLSLSLSLCPIRLFAGGKSKALIVETPLRSTRLSKGLMGSK